MALLDVRGVSKNFGAIKALTDVSLTMEPGEVVGLMGDNGAGKSTMVKLVAGNFPASEECSFSTGAVFDVSGGRATY